MGNDASTQQAAALDQGGGTKAAGGGCCMCFLPNVAPYALLVECFLRASGVTSVRRVVAPPGKEVKAHAFDFVVAVSTPGFGAAYSWAKSVVPGNGNKPGVHVALRQSVLLLCVEPHCVHGIGDDSDAVTAVTKVVRLMEVVCVDGTSGLYLHGGICDSMKEVYHFLKQLAIPAQPVHNLIQRTSRGNFEIPSGDFQDGSVACFVATLYRWFSTCMCFKVVYYLTPLRQQRQIPWLPPIDVMLGNKGVPVPRTSVDLISLDLGWLVTLQDQHILVSDVYVEYPDVRDEFIDITEAFYFSLALGLKGETIQKIISEPPTSVEPLAPTKVGGEVPSSTELGKSTTTGNSPTTSLAPLPSISSNPLDLELKLETTPPEKPLGPPPQPPFQIQTADLDQVCFWLGSAGASDNCLKVIRANKLQGRTLVNLSKEQLCDLGVPVVDAEYIVEEILKKMMEDTGSQGNDQDTGQQCQEDQASPKTIVSPNPLCEGMSRVLSTELNYKCFAFVVGNESYPKLPLQNCIKDAKSVSKLLETRCNFEVFYQENIRTLEEWVSLTQTFKNKLHEVKRDHMKVSSVFYYAGSGKEVQGHKSLMMIDSTYAENEPRHTAQLDDFMMEISTSSDLSIFILDTCFVHFENRETSEVRLPNESLVIYAGENPSDHCTLPSQHNHGHFTGCFLEVVEQAKPGTSFNHIVDETMQLVKDTGHQIPWICKSSTTRFALF